jgi:hypothetical protein
MKMNVNELTGSKLDWAVSKCDNTVWDDPEVELYLFLKNHDNGFHYYSTNWAQGGPIIEREKLELRCNDYEWQAFCFGFPVSRAHSGTRTWAAGPTPLIAAMRCYVASKLGDEIDIPEELF